MVEKVELYTIPQIWPNIKEGARTNAEMKCHLPGLFSYSADYIHFLMLTSTFSDLNFFSSSFIASFSRAAFFSSSAAAVTASNSAFSCRQENNFWEKYKETCIIMIKSSEYSLGKVKINVALILRKD